MISLEKMRMGDRIDEGPVRWCWVDVFGRETKITNVASGRYLLDVIAPRKSSRSLDHVNGLKAAKL